MVSKHDHRDETAAELEHRSVANNDPTKNVSVDARVARALVLLVVTLVLLWLVMAVSALLAQRG